MTGAGENGGKTASLRILGRNFVDRDGRQIIIHGINLGADSKLPASPDLPSHQPDGFFDSADSVSFVGRPFPLRNAPEHFGRLRRFGFNTLRYVFTWEALEHAGPKQYDEPFIDYTIKVLEMARSYGFYVIMDPHQDVWSRFSGGSGAPIWTLYACGLDPEKFGPSMAATVHNTADELDKFPKMIWPTNYYRLVCQTVFALFFAGSEFAPRAVIDGVNIQAYLQSHFIDACRHLADRIAKSESAAGCVVGWESFNEPNKGFVGYSDLTQYSDDQRLKLGPSPTGWQGLQLGSGHPVTVDSWYFGWLGPKRGKETAIDPKGVSVWLAADSDKETRYGWTRSPDWKLGECLWAQHGVWKQSPPELLQPEYFSKTADGTTLTYEHFTNTFFNAFYLDFQNAIRQVMPTAIMFCQPPVLEVPPNWTSPTSFTDQNTVFAPHFYDGLTLIEKKWNRWYNVDVFGLLRGRYRLVPAAVRFGEGAIRRCLRDQLADIRAEGESQLGVRPTVFTEIGVPFDMDDKAAYESGNFRSQIDAMDANMYALEASGAAGFTLWNYTSTNNFKWGDNWNGEDLSIYSTQNAVPPELEPIRKQIENDKLTEESDKDGGGDTEPPVRGKGFRAIEAVVRPYPVAVQGLIVSYGFNLSAVKFEMTIEAGSSDPALPTVIFLPIIHFPPDSTAVILSTGRYSIVDGSDTELRTLAWHHDAGEQTISICSKPGNVNFC